MVKLTGNLILSICSTAASLGTYLISSGTGQRETASVAADRFSPDEKMDYRMPMLTPGRLMPMKEA